MSIEKVLEDFAVKHSWNEITQMGLLQDYIDNQFSNEAFMDFLYEKVKFEDNNEKKFFSYFEIYEYMNWNNTSLIYILSEYIENQQSEEAFVDYLYNIEG